MSNLVRIQVEADTAALLRRAAPETMLRVVKRAMDRAVQATHGHITKERLTGQGPFPVAQRRLGVVTNRLRGSLRWTRAVISGDTVTAAIGSNVKYAAAHEFGFNGSVQVKAHQRRSARIDGQRATLAMAAAADRKNRRGRKNQLAVSRSTSTVKAHARKMRIPERRPVRTGIEEHFSGEFNAALRKELGNVT